MTVKRYCLKMNIKSTIKEYLNKNNKELLKEASTNIKVFLKLLLVVLIAVFITYQFKSVFEWIYDISIYPLSVFLSGYSIIFVFSIIVFTSLYLIDFCSEIMDIRK